MDYKLILGDSREVLGSMEAATPRYKQMGNAVAVPCVEWIINRLVEG